MLIAADERKVTLLSLLDMSVAFHFVGPLFLLQRLQFEVGIGDTALDWIWSFLSGRTQQVVYGGEQSGYVGGAVWRSTGLGTRTTVLHPLTWLNCLTSLRNIESMLINTPTTCNCISACRQQKLRLLLTVSMRVSLTSKPGWKQAVSDLTWTKLRWLGSAQRLAKVCLDDVRRYCEEP